MIEGHITRYKLIKECAAIVRDFSGATPADRRDARCMIMLLAGASDYFYDQHGDRIMTINEAIRSKTCELGRDDPEVIMMRVNRDHQLMIEDLLEGRGYAPKE